MAKKKRVKSNKQLIEILSWKQADLMLARIGDLQIAIQQHEADANKKITVVKEALAANTDPIAETLDLHIASLQAFATSHRTDFGDSQSRKSLFGLIGWRKSCSITVKKTTVDKIRGLFGRRAKQFLHLKETVNKEALAKLTDEDLASVDARRRRREAFFVECDLEQVAQHKR